MQQQKRFVRRRLALVVAIEFLQQRLLEAIPRRERRPIQAPAA
ncbi:hypothetical protein ACVWW5_006781 [Bradyrhizobium sp. LM3.4]